MRSKFFTILLLVGLLGIIPVAAQAQKNTISEQLTMRVKITHVTTSACPDNPAGKCQQLTVVVLGGPMQGRTFQIDIGGTATVGEQATDYHVGDVYYANYEYDQSTSKEIINIGEVDRLPGLLLLVALFVLVVLIFAGKQGAFSLLALLLNFAILIFAVAQGVFHNFPVVPLAVLAGIGIMFFSLFLSHGWQKKTVVAFLGSLFGLAVTIGLSLLFIYLTRMTGFAAEEVFYLSDVLGNFSVLDLLFLGIVVGMLGVLDDITISQAAITFQIAEANPQLSRKEVYRRTMSVGKDHAASMVNTLIVAYAGASLPLFLLLVKDTSGDLGSIVNMEIIAEEILRMLVGSIGLILTIPFTSWLASRWTSK